MLFELNLWVKCNNFVNVYVIYRGKGVLIGKNMKDFFCLLYYNKY